MSTLEFVGDSSSINNYSFSKKFCSPDNPFLFLKLYNSVSTVYDEAIEWLTLLLKSIIKKPKKNMVYIVPYFDGYNSLMHVLTALIPLVNPSCLRVNYGVHGVCRIQISFYKKVTPVTSNFERIMDAFDVDGDEQDLQKCRTITFTCSSNYLPIPLHDFISNAYADWGQGSSNFNMFYSFLESITKVDSKSLIMYVSGFNSTLISLVQIIHTTFYDFACFVYQHCEMELFKCFNLAHCVKRFYASHFLDTNTLVKHTELEVDSFFSKACYGGRTEVFKPYSVQVFSYDKKGAYSSVLRDNFFPVGPGLPYDISKGLDDFFGIGEFVVEIPRVGATSEIPPLPFRGLLKEEDTCVMEERVIYPTGTFRTVCTDSEIKVARKYGCNVKFLSGVAFTQGTPFKKMMEIMGE